MSEPVGWMLHNSPENPEQWTATAVTTRDAIEVSFQAAGEVEARSHGLTLLQSSLTEQYGDDCNLYEGPTSINASL